MKIVVSTLLFFGVAQNTYAQKDEGLVAYFPFDGDLDDKVGIFSPQEPLQFVKADGGKFTAGKFGQAWDVSLNPLSHKSYPSHGKKDFEKKEHIKAPFNYSFFAKTSRSQTAGGETTGGTAFTSDIHNYVLMASQHNYGGGGGLGLAIGNNNVSVYSHRANHYGRPFSYTASFNNDQFYHYSFNVHKNGLIELFINGELVHTAQGQADYSSVPLGIGGTGNWGGWDTNDKNRFDGAIDELRLYDRTLSAGEIDILAKGQIPEIDLKSNLIAYYPFNGNANDESGNGNQGVIHGDHEFVLGDDNRYRLQLRNESYVALDHIFPLGSSSRSISAWVSLEDKTARVLFQYGPQTTMSKRFGVGFNYRGKPGMFADIAYAVVSKAAHIEPNTLHHVAWTYEGGKSLGEVNMYLNGELVTEVNYQEHMSRVPETSSDGAEFLGGNPKIEWTFDGIVSEFRVYDRALTGAEVAALYEFKSTPQKPATPGPESALASTTVVNGFVVGLNIDFGGSGYTTPPEVRIVGGVGSGATAKAVVTDGVVTELIVLTPGIGYTSTPGVEIDPPPFPPKQALAKVQVVNGFVVGFEVTDGGRGYHNAPFVRVESENGSGAKAEAVLIDGVVTEIKVLAPGIGYDEVATVSIDPPPYPPSRAAGQAQMLNGFIVGLSVVDGGRGYTFPPKVRLVGGDGNGATAIAIVENGHVVELQLTNAGSGYDSPPEVVIDLPQPVLTISTAEGGLVRIKATAHAGANCRLEGTNDLKEWEAIGDDFVADRGVVTFKFEADLAKRFYRFVWLD